MPRSLVAVVLLGRNQTIRFTKEGFSRLVLSVRQRGKSGFLYDYASQEQQAFTDEMNDSSTGTNFRRVQN